MNNLKEIEVTDSFYELEREIRNCQNYKTKDTYDNCTTRFFMEQMRLNCGCLPYAINPPTDKKVCGKHMHEQKDLNKKFQL